MLFETSGSHFVLYFTYRNAFPHILAQIGFERIWAPKMEPKTKPKSIKNRSKIDLKIDSKLCSNFLRFLVPTWLHVGSFWGPRAGIIFWNCELVNICTTHRRQLDFQGLAGFGSACFVLFFGVWFLDGFGNGFLMIFRWIWICFGSQNP